MYLPENKEELPFSLKLFLDTVGIKKADDAHVVVERFIPKEVWKPAFQGQEPSF